MIKKVGSGRNDYFETADGWQFGRIVSGLAWPHGGKPGFVVVIAENLNEDPNLRVRHMTVIKEAETSDVANLVQRCQDWQAECQVQEWFSNTENKPLMAAFYQLTQDQPYQRKFDPSRASHSGDRHGLGYYLPVIKEHLKSNQKILHFGEGSKLPGYLNQMGAEAMSQDPAEYPPIAALGYALSYLFENRSDGDEDEQEPLPQPTGRSKIGGY
jgi:hypothetical protein